MKTDQKPLNSGFGAETTAEQIVSGIDLRGKVCVITGGHSGIGLETTRVLTKAGALVCVGAHNMTKARNNLANMNHVEIVAARGMACARLRSIREEFLPTSSAT
jgi:NAD(P)-dependent dehydrogenase (short-subunit alcohol dehydrogenase family)